MPYSVRSSEAFQLVDDAGSSHASLQRRKHRFDSRSGGRDNKFENINSKNVKHNDCKSDRFSNKMPPVCLYGLHKLKWYRRNLKDC